MKETWRDWIRNHPRQVRIGGIAFALYVLGIVAANFMINHGPGTNKGGTYFLSVGFGLEAPAGVYAAGLTFVARDFVQRFLGRWPAVLAILLGAGVSALVSNTDLAVASGVAFLCSELLDFGVYTPLQEKSFVLAVLFSGFFGCLLDTWLFLTLADIPLALAFWGLLIGKWWMQLGAGGVLIVTRPRVAIA